MNWFVISKNEHLGPYEEDVLEQLYLAGDIGDDSLVWREGMPEPKTYRQLLLDSKNASEDLIEDPITETDDELPPELPPEVLQMREASTPAPRPGREHKEAVHREVLGGEADEIIKDEEVEEVKDEEEIELDEHFEDEPKSKLVKVLLGIFFLALLAAAGAAGWMYYSSNLQAFSRPSKMDVKDYERLKTVAASSAKENVFAFALSKDKSSLWMATNNPLSGPVTLKISSIPGKSLSEERVVASSSSRLQDKIAHFDSFQFEKGQRLIQGWYEVEAATPVELEIPLVMSFLNPPPKRFRYLDRALLTSMKHHHFQKALERFNDKLIRNETAFWDELEQKYQTIKAIGISIHEALEKVFVKEPSAWVKNVQDFEREYTGNYGNFFTSFVIQNEEAYAEIAKKEFSDKNEVISYYTRLSRLAKGLGAVTMESLEEMRLLDEPGSERKRRELKESVASKFSSIMDEIDQNLERTREKRSTP